jgi:hypothetical protein
MKQYDELTSTIKIPRGGEPYPVNKMDWTSWKKDSSGGEPDPSIYSMIM